MGDAGRDVKAFLAAKGNPQTLKTWTNTALGETWAERGEAPDWQRLYDRREAGWTVGLAPEWTGLLIASVDVQRGGGGRLDVDVWAFGPDGARAFVERFDVPGSASDARTWADLDALIAREWETLDGRRLRLARVAIDTGDGSETMAVYAWARRHPGLAMAVKGRAHLAGGAAIGAPSWMDVTIGGRKLKRGVRLWNVGTHVLKAELYGALNLEKPVDGQPYPPGYVYVPMDTTDEWLKQLTAEQLVMKKLPLGGQRQDWVKTRDRNEALDNAIYARAIAISLGVDRWTPAQWLKVAGKPPEKSPPLRSAAPVQAVEPDPFRQKTEPPSASPAKVDPFRRDPRRAKQNPYTTRR